MPILQRVISRGCLYVCPRSYTHSGHRKAHTVQNMSPECVLLIATCLEAWSTQRLCVCLPVHTLSVHMSICFSYMHIYFSWICNLLRYLCTVDIGIYIKDLGTYIYSHPLCSFTLTSYSGAHALNTCPAHSHSCIVSQVLSMHAYHAYAANILLIVFGLIKIVLKTT